MRTRYDQFGKHLLAEAFAPGAAVETEVEVTVEPRRIDVWVLPDPARGAAFDDLGTLGKMGKDPSTFELCHSTPDGEQMVALIHKHGDFRRALSLRASAPPLPTQWVISSGRADEAIAGLCFMKAKGWPGGVYAGPKLLWTNLVAVNRLPVRPETLALRTLGAGATLRQALAEVDALPAVSRLRTLVKPLLLRYKLEIPKDPAQQTPDDKEFVMDTQNIVERWEKEAELRGELRGELQGVERTLKHYVIDAYELRFGPMPAALRAAVEATKDEHLLDGWHKLAVTRSAEEIGDAIRLATAS